MGRRGGCRIAGRGAVGRERGSGGRERDGSSLSALHTATHTALWKDVLPGWWLCRTRERTWGPEMRALSRTPSFQNPLFSSLSTAMRLHLSRTHFSPHYQRQWDSIFPEPAFLITIDGNKTPSFQNPLFSYRWQWGSIFPEPTFLITINGNETPSFQNPLFSSLSMAMTRGVLTHRRAL